jgi:hypothetical protein
MRGGWELRRGWGPEVEVTESHKTKKKKKLKKLKLKNLFRVIQLCITFVNATDGKATSLGELS